MFRSHDLIGMGMEADQLRRKLHPHNIATYIIDRNVNYTNVCTEYCSFCAFYRPKGHDEAYVHPKEVLYQKIRGHTSQRQNKHSHLRRMHIPH